MACSLSSSITESSINALSPEIASVQTGSIGLDYKRTKYAATKVFVQPSSQRTDL
jgi:hypothetical protein